MDAQNLTFKVGTTQLSYSIVSRTDRLIAELWKREIPLPEPEHYFGDKAYVRKLTVPKGMVVAGAIHKKDHVFAVIKGSMLVYEGDKARRVKAGDVFQSRAGVQRVAFAPDEDCACIAIHGTENTDLDELENELVIRQTKPLEVIE